LRRRGGRFDGLDLLDFDAGNAAAVHLDNGEAVTFKVEALAAAGDEAELGEDKAADGGVGGIVGELDVVLRGEIANVERGIENHGAVGEGLGVFDDVELVVNFADHLLDDVFNRNEAEDAAEFVHDHGQTDATRAKLEEELASEFAFGDDEDVAKNAAKAEVGRGEALFGAALAVEENPKHVLDMNEAEDVIERAFVGRDAGTLRGSEDTHHFFERGFDGKDVEVGARNHDFADLELAQLDGALNEFLFARGEEAAFANLADEDLQFFGGVYEGMRLRGANPHGANEKLGGVVEKNNGPAKDAEKPTKRASDEKRHALGTLDAEAFGDQLAQNDMQEGQEKKCGNHGGGVGDDDGFGAGNPLEAAKEDLRKGALSDHTKGKAGDGDADLHARENAVEIAQKLLDNHGAGVALLDELLDAGDAHGDQGELGGDEEGVEAGEKEDAEKAEEEHSRGILTVRMDAGKGVGGGKGLGERQDPLVEILRLRHRKLLPEPQDDTPCDVVSHILRCEVARGAGAG